MNLAMIITMVHSMIVVNVVANVSMANLKIVLVSEKNLRLCLLMREDVMLKQ